MPQLLPLPQRNESLRGCPILMPVIFVLFAYPLEVHGKRWIPIGKAWRCADARILRHQIPIRCQPCYWHNCQQTELSSFCLKTAILMPDVILERNGIARANTEITRGPVVEHDWSRLRSGDRGRGRRGDRSKWQRSSHLPVPLSPRRVFAPSQLLKVLVIQRGYQ